MNPSRVLESFAPLLEYPTGEYHSLAEACLAAVGSAAPAEIEEHLRSFVDRIRPSTTEELEELFTRTFDLNPTCALDIGWHLYGEQYARGDFLVSLRESLRSHGIEEETELPDHLPSVLRLIARTDAAQAKALVSVSLRPALGKMLKAFPDDQNPYSALLRAIQTTLEHLHPLNEEGNDHE